MAFTEPCFGIGHNLSLICQMTSEDIKHQLITFVEMYLNFTYISTNFTTDAWYTRQQTQSIFKGMHGLPRHVKSLSKGTLSSNNWVIVACLLPYPTLLYSTRSLATGLFSIAAPMYMSSAHVSSSSSSSSSRGSFSGSSSVSLGTELFKLWLKLGSC